MTHLMSDDHYHRAKYVIMFFFVLETLVIIIVPNEATARVTDCLIITIYDENPTIAVVEA